MKIATIVDWPDVKNAEYEVVKRLEIALESLGHELVLLNNQGFRIKLKKNGHKVYDVSRNYSDLEFCLNLHFAAPKIFDLHMYGALWNPPQFYFDWGYNMSSAHLLSFDDYLTYGSKPLDNHINNLIGVKGVSVNDGLKLAPSVPGECFHVEITKESKIFYSGINWERIGNKKGRHHDLFVYLDKKNAINIYGPKLFSGAQPWAGFKNYKGSIPFDGISAISVVNDCGISLVISSDAHRECHAATNRLYESLAAGAVIIADDNEFVRQQFGDNVLRFEYSDDPEDNARNIYDLYQWIIKNPQEAQEKAAAAQKIYLEKFKLEKLIADLIEGHADRKSKIEQAYYELSDQGLVSVIGFFDECDDEEVRRTLNSIAQQSYKEIELICCVDEDYADDFKNILQDYIAIKESRIEVIRGEQKKALTGQIIVQATTDAKGGYITFIEEGEEYFENHLASLVKTVDGAEVAQASVIFQNVIDGISTRNLARFSHYINDNNINPSNFECLSSLLVRKSYFEKIVAGLYYMDTMSGSFIVSSALRDEAIKQSLRGTLVSEYHQMISPPMMSEARQLGTINDATRRQVLAKIGGATETAVLGHVHVSPHEVRAEVRALVNEWFAPMSWIINFARRFRQLASNIKK